LKNGCLIAFLLCTSLLCSQSYTVTGDVIDEQSKPVAFANILLLKVQDSTVISGTISNEAGAFEFNEIESSRYIIKISFISYEDSFYNMELTSDMKVPSIILKESIEALSEVEITYKKPTIKREVDRLVFNVEKTALSEGNMLEVLRSTPQVLVLDNAITVKGSTPTVYINDRRVHISASEIVELLEGTSASNIKSVEVITNPPARYDAESGVVLSIIMSKNLVTGYNGSIFSNFTQGVYPKTNVGMTNYFKGERINIFANYSYNSSHIDRMDQEEINYPGAQWKSQRDRDTKSETHNFSLNFDWDLSENDVISVSTNTQFLPYFKFVTQSRTDISPRVDDAIAKFNSENLSLDSKHNLGFDFDYVHVFKKDNARLSLNSHYTTYDYNREQHVETDYFLGNDSFFEANHFDSHSNQDTEILTTQIDYALPISESASFEIGAKVSNISSSSSIIHNDIIGNAEVLNLENTDTFKYDETVYAGYISYDTSGDKWSLSTGLRVEQTLIDAISITLNQTNDQNYLEWFPTANLGFQASDKVNLYTNYKRSIGRPSYSSLNPFKFYLNDNSFSTGNPALKPIFTDQFKLGVSINNMFTIESYYKKYDNNIFEIPIQDNVTNTLAYTTLNINFTEEIGLDLEAYFDVSNRWTTYIGASFYNYSDNATLLGSTFKRDKWSNYTLWSNDFSLLKDKSLSANFTLVYVHNTVQGLRVVGSRTETNLSFRKTMFKGKGSLSLAISDLFDTQDIYTATKFFNQNSSVNTDLDTRYIKLGFRYNFGNTRLSTNERASSVDERDRLGNKH